MAGGKAAAEGKPRDVGHWLAYALQHLDFGDTSPAAGASPQHGGVCRRCDCRRHLDRKSLAPGPLPSMLAYVQFCTAA